MVRPDTLFSIGWNKSDCTKNLLGTTVPFEVERVSHSQLTVNVEKMTDRFHLKRDCCSRLQFTVKLTVKPLIFSDPLHGIHLEVDIK